VGRWLHPDRGNVACLGRGGWMEVTMISRGVEISIAGGVAETEDDLTTTTVFIFLFFIFFIFIFKSYVHCFYGTRNDMHL
jgi:hypothetical protein